MKKKNNSGAIVDVCVWIMGMFFLYMAIKDGLYLVNKKSTNVLISVIAVLLIHFIKAFRLYFAMYGSEIVFVEYLKEYCKVTIIGILFPFKLGDVYRVYCYGKQLKDYLKGTVVVLLDRFFDTSALISVIVLKGIFDNSKLNGLTLALIFFLLIVIIVYITFGKFYTFWMNYLIGAKATKRKSTSIKFLYSLNKIHKELRQVLGGKGVILYTLSLVAWVIEIICLTLTENTHGVQSTNNSVLEYLNASISGGNNAALIRFSFISLVSLGIIFMILIISKRLLTNKNMRK